MPSDYPAYYNDNDEHACAWLGNLIDANLITPGYVDSRRIQNIKATDVNGYTRVHLFAGMGGWDLALQLAGWPEDVPVWTGSCPCQPFSNAGKRRGIDDERHLWPEFRRLIDECRIPVVFGEQIASKAGREWLSGVQLEMEELGYVVGAADLCAAGVGAPHIRQRLYWMAVSERAPRQWAERWRNEGFDSRGGCETGRLDVSESQRRCQWQQSSDKEPGGSSTADFDFVGGWMGHTNNPRLEGWRLRFGQKSYKQPSWSSNFDIITCIDAKTRRIESGLQPLVDGIPFLLADGSSKEGVSRAKVLQGIGNAIVPQVAAEFIKASMEVLLDAT